MRSRASKTDRQIAPQTSDAQAAVSSGAPATRRGSALVLVVGTLAIIAVIAALYVTLGQADTRVSRGVERGGEIEDIERQVAQYIAKIVGDDRLAVMVETVANNENAVNAFSGTAAVTDRYRYIREATDYPYTDFSKVSIIADDLDSANAVLELVPGNYFNMPAAYGSQISDAVNRLRFRPSGDEPYSLDQPAGFSAGLNFGAGDADGLADRRVASDPWLASLEPVFLGRAEFDLGLGSHDHRNYSDNASSFSNVAQRQDELFYLDNRDWAQISNLAPNGLSVNLWNLRNNFDAESGLGADTDNRPRMSENRTLLSLTPTTVGVVPQFGVRASEYLHIDPLGSTTPSVLGPPGSQYTNAASFAIKNTPAWWTMNQRFLYFPADPSFQILGRSTIDDRTFQTVQTPANPDYPFYQYADADGDGFFDSRWFELTDSTLGPNGVVDLLSNETGMRFFIAARVIDLSGKINVNVATDSFVPPTSLVPAGATPSELDLRRQLTLEDTAERFVPVYGNVNAGTGSNPVPPASQRLSYANIERLPYAQAEVSTGLAFTSGDYEKASIGPDLGFTPPNGIPPLTGNGLFAGRYAYDAIRRSIQGDNLGLPSDVTDRRADSPSGGGVIQLYESTPFEYYSFDPAESQLTRSLRTGPDQTSLTFDAANPFEHLSRLAVNRRDYYYASGGANIADPGDAPLTALGFGGNLFGLEDLAELLTFNGANDDRVTTRLESVTQGRFDDLGDATVRFGPLRANRPTALERSGHDNRINVVNPGDGSAGIGSDNLIDFESMAMLALNPRTRLSTITGASPLRARPVVDRNGDGVISGDERRLTSEDLRLNLTKRPSANALFNLYADALIPYSFVDATWYNDPEGVEATVGPGLQALYNNFRTLSYGYRGSELGLRVSAHLAVNMRDILDVDEVPSVATVLAAPGVSGSDTNRIALDATLTTGHPSGGIEGSPYTWWEAGNRFDLGDDRLAPEEAELNNPADPTDFSRKAYTVFGVEAQPFITEVSVVTVYSDVPRERLTSVSGGFGADMEVSDAINDAAERETLSASYGTAYTAEDPEDRSVDFLANGSNDLGGAACDPTRFGWDDGTIDDVNLRGDTSGDNPDLMLHLLAIQLTNPFDVAINLTDNAAPYVPNPNDPTVQIPNENFINLTPGQQLDDSKFYLEFNGHFFPLAEYIEQIDYRSQVNPFVTQPGFYRIVLEPGESRVVYVSAHPSLVNLAQRWRQIEEVYRNLTAPGGSNYSALGDGSDFLNGEAAPETMNASTTPPVAYVQNYIDDQLAIRETNADVMIPVANDEVVYPARVVPFDPRSGNTLQQGTAGDRFVEFMRTNLSIRFPDTNLAVADQENAIDRMRQEVRLWRKMTAGPGDGTGTVPERSTYNGNIQDNFVGNDLLADRMRDPLVERTGSVVQQATLDYATLDWQNMQNRDYLSEVTERYDPFTAPANFWDNTTIPAQNNIQIPKTMSSNDVDGAWNFVGGTNQGLTIAMRAGFRRPDHLVAADDDGVLNDDFETPRGTLPAWCIESTGINHNIAVPTIEDAPAGTNAPQEIATSLEQALDPSIGYLGEYFGFRGCQGHPDYNLDNTDLGGGMFYMNFLRFIKDTKVRRDISGQPLASETKVRSEGALSRLATGGPGAFVDDPMLVPTITRHPALKFVRDEVVNVPLDRDGDLQNDETYDAVAFENAMQGMRPQEDDVRVAVKRTIAKYGVAPVVNADVIADNPTLLALGRDGLGDATEDFAELVRIGDLALPFGVGATYAPVNANADAADFRPGDWTTLGEALSAAMGYEPIEFYNADPGNNPADPSDPYGWSLLGELIDVKGTLTAPILPDNLMDSTQPYQTMEVLPNGRLDLHAFAPFVNLVEPGGSLQATLPRFNPTTSPGGLGSGDLNSSDYRVALSEPPAQRLFSMATAIDRTGGNPLTNPIIGTLNLNTASEAALRSVPGFTPSIQFSGAGIQYDLYNADGNNFVPSTDPMADDFTARVGERTAGNAAPPQPLAGREYEPPLGVRSLFGSWESPGSGFPAQYEADGWKATTDIAAGLVAFRDRTTGAFRFASKQNPFLPAPGGQPQPQLQPRDPEGVFEYTPSLVLGSVFNAPIFAPSLLDLTVNNYATDFARAAVSGEGAASELPGLRGVGSLLGLSIARFDPLASQPQDITNPRIQNAPFTTNWRVGVYEQVTQGSVTRNGSDTLAMSALNQDNNGIANTDPTIPGDELTLITNETLVQQADNFSYTLGRAGFVNDNPDFTFVDDDGNNIMDTRHDLLEDRRRTLEDEVVDDILEELSVFNGAANLVDVRSDFYAAWFIIRGYAKDDVQGLDDDEPMRASYEKRFLMVLDRSNVTDAGQLPRVLFIREVPL